MTSPILWRTPRMMQAVILAMLLLTSPGILPRAEPMEAKFLLGLGAAGAGPGQFARPHGMAVDRKGGFYVADAGNQRIQKFEVSDP